ncbi:MAG: peptide deformylase [Opitutales bacterium]|nr:peptide deformylase [Opitutales bacterium]
MQKRKKLKIFTQVCFGILALGHQSPMHAENLVCTYGNPVLLKPTKRVEKFDNYTKEKMEKMLITLHSIENAIGIAAPQIGISESMAIVSFSSEMIQKYEEGKKKKISNVILQDGKEVQNILELMPFVFINPSVQAIGTEKDKMVDGCLSLPGVYGFVERSHKIRLQYQDIEGIKHTLECDSLFAFCIQHETDHLHGILFIDRLVEEKLMVDTMSPCWKKLSIYPELLQKKEASKEEILEVLKKLGTTFDYSKLKNPKN